jgi:hypothetical protein
MITRPLFKERALKQGGGKRIFLWPLKEDVRIGLQRCWNFSQTAFSGKCRESTDFWGNSKTFKRKGIPYYGKIVLWFGLKGFSDLLHSFRNNISSL